MGAGHMVPEGDTEEAIAFLENTFGVHPRHLVAISQKGRVEARTFASSEEEEMRRWVADRQQEENLYFHVNRLNALVVNKKATKADVAVATFLHVDIDDPDAEKRLLSFSPMPTAVVFSGGGYHGYWRLEEPSTDLARVESINESIARALDGDNCYNIDRIMRLPGTVNIPNASKQAKGRKPELARIVFANWSLTYSLEDFFHGDKPGPAGPKGAIAQDSTVRPIDIRELPVSVSAFTRHVIEHGDDLERPRGGGNARYPSRSEAVYRVCCDLAREGVADVTIAGILVNPSLGISRSVIEKRQPQQYALRQARKGIAAVHSGWPDVDRSNKPSATMRNTVLALERLQLSFSHDLFRHRKIVNGAPLEQHQGEVSDDAVAVLRALVTETYNFDPRAENVRDAVAQLCLEHSFHPIRQFLDALVWDQIPRLGRWIITYLGAEDTALNEATGRIILIAAVRRVRQPNVKFDTIPVLEGPQGTGKSSALRILAGPGNHSDNEILGLDTKAQMEAMEGVWIYELSELSGLNKSEVERVKAFASREVDRARMSYARYSEARGRQTVFIGTTNENKYLKDRTGNRRFLPIKTGDIDLKALERDRDQLWAEAAFREAGGETIVLPRDLWAAAAAEQADRLEDDPWMEKLGSVNGRAFGDEARISTAEILEYVLGIPTERQHQGYGKRVAALMPSFGWEAAKFKIASKTVRGFRRPKPEGHVDDPDPNRPKF